MYKAEYTIPLAFELASKLDKDEDIGSITRLRVREEFIDGKLMKLIVRDLQYLLNVNIDDQFDAVTIHLWDEKNELIKYGVNYEERG